jgi:beta-glucosidase
MQNITLPASSSMLSKRFLYGVATSSFQIEGDHENRLSCIWDTFCQTDGKILDASNGDTACEHIKRWKQDVELIESLGVDAYRLSISWPRVMNEDGSVNDKGISFYSDLIDELNAKGIKVFVTLYHWELPQFIEDQGGWLNRDTAYLFRDYADSVSQRLGEKVHSYATFNEPFCSAYLGYEIGVHAPGKLGQKNGRQAAHHILLAHGLAMPMLQKNCPQSLNGIVLNFTPCYAYNDCEQDRLATQKADEYINQWYIKPLFDACYPDVFNDLLETNQPDILPGDMEIIAQPLDFLGVNFYTRLTYSAPQHADELFFEHPHREPKTDIGWEVFPEALTELLVTLSKKYTLPPVYITENGAAMADEYIDGAINDVDRISYYHTHLNAINNAIDKGVKINGYFAWSLMDNFEWAEGYTKRFGLVRVDYDTQERVIKNSGLAYRNLITSR